MRRVLPSLLVLFCAGTAAAGDVTIDGVSAVPAGGYAELSVKLPAGAQIGWTVVPAPPQRTVQGGLLIFALKPGVEYSVAVTVVDFDKKTIDTGTKTVSFAAPPVPPPPPPPPPPAPDSGFVSAVKTAYASETAADKAASVKALASLYRTAATTSVTLPSVKTYGDLFTDLKTVSVTLLPPTAIPAVRKAVGARLNASLGTNQSAAIDRTLTAAEFLAVAAALEGVAAP